MPIVHYEYERSTIVEDTVDVPQAVVASGDNAIRNFILDIILSEDYDVNSLSENEELNFKLNEAE